MLIDWDTLLPPKTAEPVEEAAVAGTTTGHEPLAIDSGMQARAREGDDRRRCTECGKLGELGICLAAQRGLIVAGRNYTPVRDLLRRCEGFAPLPTDPDQTPGRIKWAWLRDSSKSKDATL